MPGGWDAATSRQRQRRDEARAVVLAATDPANPYGAALPWPERDGRGRPQAGRKAGALVVLVDGTLVLYVERGGKTLLSFSSDDGCLPPAVDALALAVRDGALGKLTVTKADGEAALTSPLGPGAGGRRLPADAARPAADARERLTRAPSSDGALQRRAQQEAAELRALLAAAVDQARRAEERASALT